LHRNQLRPRVIRVSRVKAELGYVRLGRVGLGQVGLGWSGQVKQRKFFLKFKIFYTLQIYLISTQIKILNDSYSQNKIQNHFITK
jgi:hypothetical protein